MYRLKVSKNKYKRNVPKFIVFNNFLCFDFIIVKDFNYVNLGKYIKAISNFGKDLLCDYFFLNQSTNVRLQCLIHLPYNPIGYNPKIECLYVLRSQMYFFFLFFFYYCIKRLYTSNVNINLAQKFITHRKP